MKDVVENLVRVFLGPVYGGIYGQGCGVLYRVAFDLVSCQSRMQVIFTHVRTRCEILVQQRFEGLLSLRKAKENRKTDVLNSRKLVLC